MSDISYSKFLIKSKFNPKKAKKYMESYDKIMESGLFDKNYYLKAYPHIAKSGMDPLVHYLFYGYKEDKNPSAQFNLKRYLEEYPEIKKMGLNPLVHYIDNDHEGFTLEENPFVARRKKILDTNSLFLADYSFDSEPLVSIIILNRNGLGHLQRLFADFDKKTNYSNYEIIVVDNASCDKSVEYLHSLNLPIRVIENSENVSFSKGNNDAAKIANGEYILLLNNDIEPTYGWLNEMVGAIVNNEDAVSVGAKLVFPFYENNRKKSFRIQHSGDIFAERMYPCCLYAINKSNDHLDIFDSSLTKNAQCVAVTGAVDLIDKKVYDELGGLDEDYIYGLEDVDFSLKLHKKGYKTILASNALLFHHESSTRVKSKDYEDNDKYNYKVFWSKWGNYLSKNMLLDKIHDNKFFTQKKLKITIVDENYHDNFEFLSKISKGFNELGFTVELISDLENMYIGNSSDILLCLSEDYDLENMVARDDIVRVFISQNSKDNPKGYDIVVSDENKTFDSKYNFAIKDNFVKEFLENLEDILIKSDGFL